MFILFVGDKPPYHHRWLDTARRIKIQSVLSFFLLFLFLSSSAFFDSAVPVLPTPLLPQNKNGTFEAGRFSFNVYTSDTTEYHNDKWSNFFALDLYTVLCLHYLPASITVVPLTSIPHINSAHLISRRSRHSGVGLLCVIRHHNFNYRVN